MLSSSAEIESNKNALPELLIEGLNENNSVDSNGAEYLEAQEREPFLKDDVKAYIFTSWCRFPYYETDFGWGNPIWVTSINLILNNTVTLMDTKTGEGIEAWVTLDELDMARFECEQELLAFASANPSAYEPVTHHDY
ncbi:Vinorine synthase-like [Thalictrum thalictroides]|uniref:Vinorine synthase-like n=1 Tax=Thalictrum thalictroides TaxID=46969 RepID=A0A7J6XGB9_THATH|nr:Vinorine synthase-like [Thalictrum thalictroides]